MKPIGPLMVEHRLIERMIALLKKRRRRPAKATLSTSSSFKQRSTLSGPMPIGRITARRRIFFSGTCLKSN